MVGMEWSGAANPTTTTSGAIGTTVSGSNGSNMLSLGLQVDWMVWCTTDATETAAPFPAAAGFAT